MEARDWIDRLGLQPHPEGGWFAETHRSQGQMVFVTSIYFLLQGHEVSHLHRLRSEELWYFHAGAPLTIHILDDTGARQLPLNGQGAFQQVVPAGAWFGASLDDPETYALVGCAVAPGFHFEDFELAQRAPLLARYPEHAALIRRLTPA